MMVSRIRSGYPMTLFGLRKLTKVKSLKMERTWSFKKIEHDLQMWQEMNEEIQELWIGRSKRTGLLLGTLSRDQDRKLA